MSVITHCVHLNLSGLLACPVRMYMIATDWIAHILTLCAASRARMVLIAIIETLSRSATLAAFVTVVVARIRRSEETAGCRTPVTGHVNSCGGLWATRRSRAAHTS